MGASGRSGGGPDLVPPRGPGDRTGAPSGQSGGMSGASGAGSSGSGGSGAWGDTRSDTWGLPALTNVPDPPLGQAAGGRAAVEAPPEAAARASRTLTGRMRAAQARAIQPPDIARQALRELDVLARELAAVPAALERANLVREQRRTYFETARAYLDLAQAAWVAVAEERLEQTGAEPEYRQRAIGVARRLTRLQQQARQVIDQIPPEMAPARRPGLWGARVSLMRAGLREWQGALEAPADPLRMGEGLYKLRGTLSLAMASGLPFFMLRLLTGAALALTPLVALGAALMLAASLAVGRSAQAAGLGLVVLGTLALWALTLILTSLGQTRLGALLGALCHAWTRSAANGRTGAMLVSGALRVWWLLVGIAGSLGTLAALGFTIQRQIAAGALVGAQGLPAWLWRIGQLLITVVGLPALVSLAAVAALALPVLVVVMVGFIGELGGNRTWVPAARRAALGPSLSALALLSGALFGLVAWGATVLGWDHTSLFSLGFGGVSLSPTPRAALLAGALLLPYALLHEVPYRVGIARWRARWLRELATRHADLESHVRRLSAADPRSGEQNTSEENLRAMQYDLVLLDFYRAKEVEARRVARAPHRLASPLVPLALAVICALVADGIVGWILAWR